VRKISSSREIEALKRYFVQLPNFEGKGFETFHFSDSGGGGRSPRHPVVVGAS